MANVPDVFLPPNAQGVQDIYRGIIAPQGGVYTPGKPVMLPPVGMDRTTAIKQALLADPVGPGANWNQFDDQVSDYTSQSPGDVTKYYPSAAGTQVASKDQTRLSPGPAVPAFAYGPPSPTAPSVAAIAAATKPNPFVPLQGIGSAFRGGWGSSLFNRLPNGMPVDSDVPLNAAQYPASRGAARKSATVAPAVQAALLATAAQQPSLAANMARLEADGFVRPGSAKSGSGGGASQGYLFG